VSDAVVFSCQLLEGSGCFFHGKLIAPIFPRGRGLLPPRKAKHGVVLPALKGGTSRKGNYLFKIASLHPALKGRAFREASRPVIVGVNVLNSGSKMQGSCPCEAWQATTRHLAVKKIPPQLLMTL
jgi:hypothetical protein